MEKSDSKNYFDVEKEFFLIDSDNLQSVQTKVRAHIAWEIL